MGAQPDERLANRIKERVLCVGVVRQAQNALFVRKNFWCYVTVCLLQNLHSNLVNSARYFQLAQGLECFISCSASDNDSMYLGDITNIICKPAWPGFVKRANNRLDRFQAACSKLLCTVPVQNYRAVG